MAMAAVCMYAVRRTGAHLRVHVCVCVFVLWCVCCLVLIHHQSSSQAEWGCC